MTDNDTTRSRVATHIYGDVNSPWLTRPQLAKRLRLEAKTLANWASKGIGPKYTLAIGGRARYHIDDVIEWETNALNEAS
jgi:hypothetical protein